MHPSLLHLVVVVQVRPSSSIHHPLMPLLHLRTVSLPLRPMPPPWPSHPSASQSSQRGGLCERKCPCQLRPAPTFSAIIALTLAAAPHCVSMALSHRMRLHLMAQSSTPSGMHSLRTTAPPRGGSGAIHLRYSLLSSSRSSSYASSSGCWRC